MQYLTLLKILDKLCAEAPAEFKSYRASASDIEKLNHARSRAFIHLYLKVKFGIDSFVDREAVLTDGPQDGGLDAYYIDVENKKLYLIQSKFRATSNNFEEKSITADELLKMELKKIIQGETTDSNDKPFNGKIKQFQRAWSNIRDQANYAQLVVILGNLKHYNPTHIKRLVENSNYEIFDYHRSYRELVFPVCCGVHYDPKEITIRLNIDDSPSILKQKVRTEHGNYDVKILFVPTEEIGRVLSKYKNAMLEYNPRNYLAFAKNPVNRKIRDSITEKDTNEFAILNNGITMIADHFNFTDATGQKGVGQVIIGKPQVINGGQTAYVLSELYDNPNSRKQYFKDKDVLLKVIEIKDHNLLSNRDFIESISNATNQQTAVKEADRRSNEKIQMELQQKFFNSFGLFYERKKGQFYSGTQCSYLEKDNIIDRGRLMRSYMAYKGDAAGARTLSEDVLFKLDHFEKQLGGSKNFLDMLFAYVLMQCLKTTRKNKKDKKWGQGLQYGKNAIIAAIGTSGHTISLRMSLDDITEQSKKLIEKMGRRWARFEKTVARKRTNREYKRPDKGFDFDNYYKGKTVNDDIRTYFSRKT